MANSKPHLLLVEDDDRLGRQLLVSLAPEYDVTWVEDGLEVIRHAEHEFSLVILDLMLPGAHGFTVLRALRAASPVPVLILSGCNETACKIEALRLGADDYMTKPFWPEELLARLRARLRRPTLASEDEYRLDELRIEFDARRVFIATDELTLTKVEFDLLSALSRRLGAVVTRRSLVDQILDPDREGTERTLDVHVSRLRKKLGPFGACIGTVWGVGYRFDASAVT